MTRRVVAVPGLLDDLVETFGFNAAGGLVTHGLPDTDGGISETVTTAFSTTTELPVAMSGAATYVDEVSYDAAGRPVELTMGTNGTAANRTWDYDPATGRVVTLRAGKGTVAWGLIRLDYTWDDSSNVTRIIDYRHASQRHCYDYDDLGRLTGAFTGNDTCTTGDHDRGPAVYEYGYTYSPSGNLTSKAVTVDADGDGYTTTTTDYEYDAGPHQVTEVGSDAFSYDANGAMTLRTVSGVTQELTYDETHRLRGIEVTAGGSDETTFLYDADGNRVRATTNETHTFYAGDWSFTEGDQDAAVVYRFGGLLVATRDATDEVWWSVDDHLSSTSVQYHPGTGVVKDQRFYPFGSIRIDDSVTTDVGYTGQRLDASGLMFYQARYYDPAIGRFTSADTIVPDPANPQDLNRYTYVNNNPLKYTDPTGHCAFGLPCPGFIEDAKDTAGEVLSAGAELVTDVGGAAVEVAAQAGAAAMESAGTLKDMLVGVAVTSSSQIGQGLATAWKAAAPHARTALNVGKNVAVVAGATALASAACVGTAWYGCPVAVGVAAGAVFNWAAEETIDCLYDDCGNFGLAEGSLDLAEGAFLGGTGSALRVHAADYVGAEQRAISLWGLLRNPSYGPSVVAEIVFVQWFPRAERFLFQRLFQDPW